MKTILTLFALITLGGCGHPPGWHFSEASALPEASSRDSQGDSYWLRDAPPLPLERGRAKIILADRPCGDWRAACSDRSTNTITLNKVMLMPEAMQKCSVGHEQANLDGLRPRDDTPRIQLSMNCGPDRGFYVLEDRYARRSIGTGNLQQRLHESPFFPIIARGPDATELEHDLAAEGDTSETITRTFTVSAEDGIQEVVIGGTTFTLAQMEAFETTNGTVDTGEGVLTLSGYTGDAFGGTVSYSYMRSAMRDDNGKAPTGNDTPNATGSDDSVALTVNGIGGITVSEQLVIRAVDDTPSAVNEGPVTVAEAAADAANTATTNTVSVEVAANDNADADTPKRVTPWENVTTAHPALDQDGIVTLNTERSYSVALNDSAAMVQPLTADSTLTQTTNYTMQNAEGDSASATPTITVTDANDGSSVVTAAATETDVTVLEHLTAVSDTNATIADTFTVSASDRSQELWPETGYPILE